MLYHINFVRSVAITPEVDFWQRQFQVLRLFSIYLAEKASLSNNNQPVLPVPYPLFEAWTADKSATFSLNSWPSADIFGPYQSQHAVRMHRDVFNLSLALPVHVIPGENPI